MSVLRRGEQRILDSVCKGSGRDMRLGSGALFASVAAWLRSLGFAARAALSTPLETDGEESDKSTPDTDFEGWLHGDPMVIGDPASRYRHGSPGYPTRNGLGSLEVGAADD